MSHRLKIILWTIIFLLIGVGIFFLWNWRTGTFKFGAETIFGCQSTRAISSVVGSPGTNLTSYDFLGNTVTVNNIIVPSLDNVQTQVKALNTGYMFANVQTYNYRSVRGGGGLSLHSYGIAIDVNPQSNGQGSGRGDIPQSIIDVFHKNGFQWGGDWEGRTNDPMHFEWYGDNVNGSFLDATSGQKIVQADLVAKVDGVAAPTTDGEFHWVLDSINPHKIVVTADGYQKNEFDLGLTCFENRVYNISLTPLPENTPGSISGKVSFKNNNRILIPAAIYLDGKLTGSTNVTGDYIINDVKKGTHKVEAKILMFPSAAVTSPDMKPGQNIQNINIVIGQ
jgi:hypothetical protein